MGRSLVKSFFPTQMQYKQIMSFNANYQVHFLLAKKILKNSILAR